MKTSHYYSFAGAFVLFVVGLVTIAAMQAQKVESAAYAGMPAKLQSATTTTVGPGVVTVFEETPYCNNRVITTQSQEIKVLFGDAVGLTATSVSATVGHLQAASTTVSYDSGLYGCGKMVARASASTTITISSF